MIRLQEKIVGLTPEELVQLSEDIQKPVLDEQALLSKVIKDTEYENVSTQIANIVVATLGMAEMGKRYGTLVKGVRYLHTKL